jgi:hypothetical protein
MLAFNRAIGNSGVYVLLGEWYYKLQGFQLFE